MTRSHFLHPIALATGISLGALSSGDACADWAVVGAAYSCSGQLLQIQATVQSSSGNIVPAADMRVLREGPNRIQCRLGTMLATAKIRYTPPGERGECGSAGTIWVESLTVNGAKILETPGYMNNYCTMEPTYTRMEVDMRAGGVKICKGLWNWGDVFEDETCAESFLPLKVRETQ